MKRYIIQAFPNTYFNHFRYLNSEGEFVERSSYSFKNIEDAEKELFRIAEDRKSRGFSGRFSIIEQYVF